eukprot:1153098-Pelagomonas_calceolata.AAC.10
MINEGLHKEVNEDLGSQPQAANAKQCPNFWLAACDALEDTYIASEDSCHSGEATLQAQAAKLACLDHPRVQIPWKEGQGQKEGPSKAWLEDTSVKAGCTYRQLAQCNTCLQKQRAPFDSWPNSMPAFCWPIVHLLHGTLQASRVSQQSNCKLEWSRTPKRPSTETLAHSPLAKHLTEPVTFALCKSSHSI